MLFIVPIEPIETRYTKHWYEYFPDMFSKEINTNVYQIQIPYEMVKNDDGGFFNFANTCVYKSKQAAEIARLFFEGIIQENDAFLITDYWNPQVVSTIRYCSATLGIPVKVFGICHAGYWDPHDILHKTFNKANKSKYAIAEERALDSSYDVLFFATEFSKNLYSKTHPVTLSSANREVTGFPMSYYDNLDKFHLEKENLIIFPHRIADEKHPELFDRLAERMPDYYFVKTIEVTKTKKEYHRLLSRAKYAVSFADQETLGISMSIEALSYKVFPIVPDKLSYKEMFGSPFKYDPNEDPVLAVEKKIRDTEKESQEDREALIKYELETISEEFFSGKNMFKIINERLK